MEESLLGKRKKEKNEIIRTARMYLAIILIVVLLYRVWVVVSVSKTIKDYNSLMQVAYNTLNLQLMQEVATDKELRRLQAILADLYTKREKADVILTELEIKSVSWGIDFVEIETSEEWIYKLFNLTDGNIIREDRYNYYLVYELVRSGLNWKVNEVNILKETRKRI